MKIFCSSSSDAYITDKIIDGDFRASDSNTGRAGTLDLFKLYDENALSGVENQTELSRILVKFDLSKLRRLSGNLFDYSSTNFKAKIKMFDVTTGHASPSNYTLVAHPLSRSFEEGVGRNLSKFSDLGVVNFLTASIENGSPVTWFTSGAASEGSPGSPDIDIIGSGTFDDANVFFYGTQFFREGNEDLSIDVTSAISGTLAGYIPDCGFRIAFSGSDESDQKTRFVKRFGTRHSANPYLRPRLEVSFDNSVQNHRGDFYFNSTGSIFLENSLRSSRSNIMSGSSQITGLDCINVKLKKGNWSKIVKASQHTGSSGVGSVGIYSASFSIDSNDSQEYSRGKTLKSLIEKEKEVTFDEFWYSLDGTVGFHTGSLNVKVQLPSDSISNRDLDVYAVNCRSLYRVGEEARIKLFAIDHNAEVAAPSKKIRKKSSEILEKVYYRISDADTLQPVFDFGESDNSTRVSTSTELMYFDFHLDVLPPGRAYFFEYLVIDRGDRILIRDEKSRFTVK